MRRMLRLKKPNEIKLSKELEDKIEEYAVSASDKYASSLFTWDEFKTVFLLKHLQFSFYYHNIMFTIFNCGEYAEFWIDGDDSNTYTKYDSADKLLREVCLQGKPLQAVWKELIFAT